MNFPDIKTEKQLINKAQVQVNGMNIPYACVTRPTFAHASHVITRSPVHAAETCLSTLVAVRSLRTLLVAYIALFVKYMR